MRARKSTADSLYEARKQAFNDLTLESAGFSPPNGEREGQPQAVDKPRRAPARPRVFGLANERNIVGMDQQEERHSVRREKYGFFTVVNDAYFDTGPTVRKLSAVHLACLDVCSLYFAAK